LINILQVPVNHLFKVAYSGHVNCERWSEPKLLNDDNYTSVSYAE